MRASGEREREEWVRGRRHRFVCVHACPHLPLFPPQVDEDYIQDDFNLSGLGASVPYYDHALDLILDADPPPLATSGPGGAPGSAAPGGGLTDEQHDLVESAAEVLYGLIHARWIVTARGQAAVLEKHRSGDYGRCPRIACGGACVLPLGPSDVPRQATVTVFCPRCGDAYHPRSRGAAALDGAYFGTTAAHLLLLTHPPLRRGGVRTGGGGGSGNVLPSSAPPAGHDDRPVPRVFGFRVHASALEPPAAGGGGRGEEVEK